MMGGLTGIPVACSTGPGSPMPMPARSAGVPAGLAEQRLAFLDHPAQDGLRAVGDVLREPPLGEDVAAEVGDGNDHVRGADVDCQDSAGGGVEGKARRRPAAAGARLTGGSHQAGGDQGVDAGGDGGAGQAGGQGQFGAGPGLAVAEQLEEVAGPGKVPAAVGSGVGSGLGAGLFPDVDS